MILRRRIMVSEDDRVAPEGFVDLGLPSGTFWAEKNLGASADYDAGLFFSWANIQGYAAGRNYNFNENTYNSTTGHGLNGDITNATYDAVMAADVGNGAKMPSSSDFNELISNTDIYYINDWNGSGKKVLKLANKKDSDKYIIIPAGGYYNGTSMGYENQRGYLWSATYYSSSQCYRFDFQSATTQNVVARSRYLGQNIRAVIKP